jgi:glutamine synthetase
VTPTTAPLDLKALAGLVASGEIDTVVTVFPDVFGRLVGKRFTGRYFLEHVAEGATHGCSYLLTVNIEMEPMNGFSLANWSKGFGDFELRPDLGTLRLVPWQPATALVICDLAHADGSPVEESPREVLRRQVRRLEAHGLTPYLASELEFFLFNDSFHDAFKGGYRGLTPSSDYRIDYHTMQTTRDEPFLRQARNQMGAAGIPIESSKGEWGRGQHEINFGYDLAIPVADRHCLFKQGLKEIAAQHSRSLTFMAKPWAEEVGSSCHIHVSLWRDGRNLFWDPEHPEKGTAIFRQFLGGLLAYSPELCLAFAPTVNSYKRYQAESWAPTRMAWSNDNRTVGYRVVGREKAFRIENRMPGADANPYLAFAAMLAAGLAGIENDLDCGADYRGNAYVDPTLRSLPSSLQEAAELYAASSFARTSLGDAVVDYYAHAARLESRAYADAVTDWERTRYFEQI